MNRDYSLFVKDILQAIEDIESFIGDMDFHSFCSDKKTRSAVVHELEIIGEATKNIPKSTRDKYKGTPWRDMARMRDKISHFYFGVKYEIVWKVVKERLPEIKTFIERILLELKHQEHSE
jgi:uncharacterized protein with HEPN domain